MFSMDELNNQTLAVPQPDPVALELDRLHNLLKERERDLGCAQGEIKALRATDALKDKALQELKNELTNIDEKLRLTENALQQKNLETKRLAEERRDALAAQFAAEAALRRVHANQKDDDSPPIESIIAPLEADIKMYKNEMALLQEDKKALERLTKSKEAALLETERILKSALERALIVEEIQNQNFELKRQIEICQEENKILEKNNRQKVLEVEKLSQTIRELEEAILAGGAAANAIRDYKRQVSELNEEKRILQRELARVKVSANRVATAVANEWKNENDKVMPVKQWIEERKLLQAEMQRIKDKLALTEKTAKAEAQLKEKYKLRLKTLEEGLKHVSSFAVNTNITCGTPKTLKRNQPQGIMPNFGGLRTRSSSQPRASIISKSSPLHQNLEKRTSSEKYVSGEKTPRRSLRMFGSTDVDEIGKENSEMTENADANEKHEVQLKSKIREEGKEKLQQKESANPDDQDVVSGFLYDRLQKEVTNLRKFCEVKDNSINAKDEEITMLIKKVDALTKATEVESRKTKREAVAEQKATVSAAKDDKKKQSRSFLKRYIKAT